jgi:hypothetical protein
MAQTRPPLHPCALKLTLSREGHLFGSEERLEALEHQVRSVECQLRWWRGLACGLIVLALLTWALPLSTAQENARGGGQGLAQRIAALKQKLRHLASASDEEGRPEVVITGANLRIVNGLGTTDTTNKLGNLIVGYNEPRNQPDSPDVRTGSHNVVVGRRHNFTSFGGLVVGDFNEISGAFSSVSGGEVNTASNSWSSVCGGSGNTAAGEHSSVCGGEVNTADGLVSSISGGSRNTAHGVASSVSGGEMGTADGFFSAVCGGSGNTASGSFSAVCGGRNNTAAGTGSTVSGGNSNSASGEDSSVSGGHNRTALGEFDWVAGPLFADE